MTQSNSITTIVDLYSQTVTQSISSTPSGGTSSSLKKKSTDGWCQRQTIWQVDHEDGFSNWCHDVMQWKYR